ncbi:hypothetical protein [Sphingomonas sp. MMS24-J13]|uniref:hypothetical protein n=1 Tax=Sphingomonas sp. MMS24-J13 TaxID=3238686 RepID=UPI0038500DEE
MLDRSMAVSATRIAAPADTRIVRADFDASRPADAGYAVPGVLDDRSWKPEYDEMPVTHVASYVRHRAAPLRPDDAMPATIAGAAEQPVATSILPAEKEPAVAADDDAVSGPQLQS